MNLYTVFWGVRFNSAQNLFVCLFASGEEEGEGQSVRLKTSEVLNRLVGREDQTTPPSPFLGFDGGEGGHLQRKVFYVQDQSPSVTHTCLPAKTFSDLAGEQMCQIRWLQTLKGWFIEQSSACLLESKYPWIQRCLLASEQEECILAAKKTTLGCQFQLYNLNSLPAWSLCLRTRAQEHPNVCVFFP